MGGGGRAIKVCYSLAFFIVYSKICFSQIRLKDDKVAEGRILKEAF